MKILVTGSEGMLGRDVIPRLEARGFDVGGHDIDRLDITRREQVSRVMEALAPELVINCAAYTAVDRAESEPGQAFAVNRDGTGYLAGTCAGQGIPLIHVSTDYVFDGRSTRPYKEDDEVNPLGVYGRSKLEGEESVRSSLEEHLIVRTSWSFGVNGHNFVKTMLKLAGERDELRVVADQHGCPTWTGHLGDALARLAEQVHENRDNLKWGTYHFCGQGMTTWYDFAACVVEEAGKRTKLRASRIVPIKASDYPTAAKRPAWSVLDCSKMERTFQIYQGDWHEGLSKVLDSLLLGGQEY